MKPKTIKQLQEEKREICLNCKHTKRFHTKGFCSQPTCMCNCFIESGLIYTSDVLNAFRQGYEKATLKQTELLKDAVGEIVDEDYPDISNEEDRGVFIKWKENFKKRIKEVFEG